MDSKFINIILVFWLCFTLPARGDSPDFVNHIDSLYPIFTKLSPAQQDSVVNEMIARIDEVPEQWRSFVFRHRYVSASDAGRNTEALIALKRAYEMDVAQDNNNAICSDLSNLIGYFLAQDKPGKASIYIQELEDRVDNVEKNFKIDFQFNLAGFYHLQGNYKKALQKYKLVKKMARSMNLANMQHLVYSNLANMYFYKMDNEDSSYHYANLALNMENSRPRASTSLNDNIIMGVLHYNRGNYARAERYLLKADSLSTPYTSMQKLTTLYQALESLYGDQENYYQSYRVLKKLDSLKTAARDTSRAKLTRELEEKYANDYLHTRQKLVELELAQKERQSTFLIIGVALLVALLITLFIVFNQRRRLNVQRVKALQEQMKRQEKEKELKIYEGELRGRQKEQVRVGQDLHDRLGGVISASKLHVHNALGDSEEGQKIMDLLSEAAGEVKRISKDLITPLSKHPLDKAIRRLTQRFGKNGLHANLNFYGLDQHLPEGLKADVISIINELITNSHEHAEATKYFLTITRHQHQLSIIYEDDGKGVSADFFESSTGAGAINIKRRTENLKGSVYLDTINEQGFNLILNIPLDAYED